MQLKIKDINGAGHLEVKERTFGVKEQAFGVKEQDLGGQGAGKKSS